MANNRLYLQCGACGESFVLAYQGTGHTAWAPANHEDFVVAFTDWLIAHQACLCGAHYPRLFVNLDGESSYFLQFRPNRELVKL